MTATPAGTNIYDFNDLTAPFSGALVLKPTGSIGYGSPYPVDQVYVELYTAADASGAFGNATFEPALETLPTSLIAWYSVPGLNAFSTEKLDTPALAGDEAVSIKTTKDQSRLRVYYVSNPTASKLMLKPMLILCRDSARTQPVRKKSNHAAKRHYVSRRSSYRFCISQYDGSRALIGHWPLPNFLTNVCLACTYFSAHIYQPALVKYRNQNIWPSAHWQLEHDNLE